MWEVSGGLVGLRLRPVTGAARFLSVGERTGRDVLARKWVGPLVGPLAAVPVFPAASL